MKDETPQFPHPCMVSLDDPGLACDDRAFDRFGIDCPAHIARSMPQRRQAFLAGRLAARRALALLGLARQPVPVGEHGEPIWPAGVCGSITHCGLEDGGVLAAAAVTAQACVLGIGIDIEAVVDQQRGQSLAPMLMMNDELAPLAALPMSRERALTIAFSAKESFFKASFGAVGRRFGYRALAACDWTVSSQPGSRLRGALCLRLRDTLAPSLAGGQDFSAVFEEIRPGVIFTSVVLRHAVER